MTIQDYLKSHDYLLLDGAMGTYYAAQTGDTSPCERANGANPDAVLAIHKAYLQAGAKAIKTNTFAANRLTLGQDWQTIVAAGYDLAQQAAGDEAFVLADIGPITGVADALAEYRLVVDAFLEKGARNFLFETAADFEPLDKVAAYIKEKAPDAFVLVSFAAQPDGFTRSGLLVTQLLTQAAAEPAVDALGLNCVCGPRHMRSLVEKMEKTSKPLCLMPNAAYPTVRGSRTFYDGDPRYFAQELEKLRALGVKLLGGCCGTTPDYIAQAQKTLAGPATVVSYPAQTQEAASAPEAAPVENSFWEALCDPARKPFAVELDSPANADVTKFMAGARELKEKGASIITIADCPIARARMDSSLMACKLQRELGMAALPHMTCRDRNLNATQALLLGLCAEQVRNVLVITGDPIPSASRDEVKSVYNFNSRKLIAYVKSLNETVLPQPFQIFGALNLNVRNFHMQLQLAQEKEEKGACGFLTQPVLSAQALENLKLARQSLKGKILGGIMPVVSQRNAIFMENEISGINVCQEIIDLYAGADRERGEELAVTVSAAIAKEIAPYVDGFYLMTPFGRTGLMGRIMDKIRQDGLTGE
jgi:homocysteine S-methyltransferase